MYAISGMREASEETKEALVGKIQKEYYGAAQSYAQHMLDALREVDQLYDLHLLKPSGPDGTQPPRHQGPGKHYGGYSGRCPTGKGRARGRSNARKVRSGVYPGMARVATVRARSGPRRKHKEKAMEDPTSGTGRN